MAKAVANQAITPSPLMSSKIGVRFTSCRTLYLRCRTAPDHRDTRMAGIFHPSVVCIGEHSALLDTPTQAVDDDGSGHLAPPEDPSLLAVRLNSPSVDSGIG